MFSKPSHYLLVSLNSAACAGFDPIKKLSIVHYAVTYSFSGESRTVAIIVGSINQVLRKIHNGTHTTIIMGILPKCQW